MSFPYEHTSSPQNTEKKTPIPTDNSNVFVEGFLQARFNQLLVRYKRKANEGKNGQYIQKEQEQTFYPKKKVNVPFFGKTSAPLPYRPFPLHSLSAYTLLIVTVPSSSLLSIFDFNFDDAANISTSTDIGKPSCAAIGKRKRTTI